MRIQIGHVSSEIQNQTGKGCIEINCDIREDLQCNSLFII